MVPLLLNILYFVLDFILRTKQWAKCAGNSTKEKLNKYLFKRLSPNNLLVKILRENNITMTICLQMLLGIGGML